MNIKRQTLKPIIMNGLNCFFEFNLFAFYNNKQQASGLFKRIAPFNKTIIPL